MNVFMNSVFLFLLGLVPLLLLLCIGAAAARRRTMERLLDPGMARRLLPSGVRKKRRITELCLLAAVAFVILGSARPVWDTETVQHPETGRDLVFLLDISQSMLAEDQPPSRLACAKNSILQCLDAFSSGRVGLVVFAGSTSIRCPLTRDFEFFRSTLDALAPDSVPVGGTRIGDAIDKTVEKVLSDEAAGYRDVVLITDGGNHGPVNTNVLAALAETEARLIIVGLGSDSVPAEIPVRDEESSKVEPLMYRDRVVHTVQQSEVLQRMAEVVPGSVYLNVGTNPLDLADVYRTHVAATLRPGSEEPMTERPEEQYWRFLLAALAFLFAGCLPWCSAEARRGGLVRRSLPAAMFALLLTTPAVAESRGSLFRKGLSAYREGDFGAAIGSFSEAYQKASDPVIDYNLGTCHYRNGDMQYALMCFARAAESAESEELSAIASYNMGNTMFMMAFSEESMAREDAMDLLRGSIAAYESALDANPDHEDAVFNLNTARRALELMRSAGEQDTDNAEGTESREVGEDEDPTQQSEATSTDQAADRKEETEEEDDHKAPNLTPEEVLEEEEKNKLSRSRKTHSGFGKTRKNW